MYFAISVERFDFKEGKHYTHRFPALGSYSIQANVSNSVNWMVVSTSIEVIHGIKGFNIEVTPAHVGIGETVSVGVVMVTGSSVVFRWDWGEAGVSPITRPQEGDVYFILFYKHK